MAEDADREDARQHAERAVNMVDKEAWLSMAEEWLKLAQSVEDRTP